jgi:hypothetical protein
MGYPPTYHRFRNKKAASVFASLPGVSLIFRQST